ncbi:MAG: YigZ family protein [Oscillospiraceae bacterium]|nr:YigZ family protein [Oscillospiraceae bacterium]
MDEFRVPTRDAADEFTEKRSRFLTHIWRTETEADATARIKQMREEFWDATHNVYAYQLRSGGVMRYSDDGEPQGTAGMPVLDVLRKEQLFDVTVVVTRYFGGIQLGGGGLVRAYSHAAKLGVDAAGVSIKRVWRSLDVPCPYHLFDRIRQEVAACGGIVDGTDYGAEILLHVLVPDGQTQALLARLVDASSGRIEAAVTGAQYRAFPID